MKSAKDIRIDEALNVMLIGAPGSGKTSQLRTLQGKSFAYIFDPNALATLRGSDIDFEIFLPDRLDINVKALSSKVKGDDIRGGAEPLSYIRFEEHFVDALDKGFFEEYDNILFDSFTTFSDAIMDRVLWQNKRLGRFPQQDDWTAQMNTILNVWRELTALQKTVVATAHDEIRQEEGSGRFIFQPILTGKLKVRVPLLFSEVFRMECDRRSKGAVYVCHTVGDARHQYVRTSIRGLDVEEDVTIPDEDWDNPVGLGLGAIIAETKK